jgi:hypothetical protein
MIPVRASFQHTAYPRPRNRQGAERVEPGCHRREMTLGSMPAVGRERSQPMFGVDGARAEVGDDAMNVALLQAAAQTLETLRCAGD